MFLKETAHASHQSALSKFKECWAGNVNSEVGAVFVLVAMTTDYQATVRKKITTNLRSPAHGVATPATSHVHIVRLGSPSLPHVRFFASPALDVPREARRRAHVAGWGRLDILAIVGAMVGRPFPGVFQPVNRTENSPIEKYKALRRSTSGGYTTLFLFTCARR